MGMKKPIAFALAWFLFVIWGLEIGVAWVFKSITGSWISQSSTMYLSKVWAINLSRFLIMFAMLRWLDMDFSDLGKGRFEKKELTYSLAIVLSFLAVEVAYLGDGYSLQILREFRYHLGISPNEWLAAASLISEYIYYTLEILAVNLLYAGAMKLGDERLAILLPTLLWGLAHILNVIVVPPTQALLLGIYMATFALLTYFVARRTKSLKVPIFVWLLSMIL